jgi:hypothetical protein
VFPDSQLLFDNPCPVIEFMIGHSPGNADGKVESILADVKNQNCGMINLGLRGILHLGSSLIMQTISGSAKVTLVGAPSELRWL